MSHLTRRGFLRSGGLAAAALGLRPRQGRAASSGASVLTRYSVQSPQGKKMLAILADAVTKMRARAESDPRSWVFQWYTHLVAGPGSTAEEFDQNKQDELRRVFANGRGPDRKLAEAMWNTCEPHVNADMGDFFLPWHRMYVLHFEQIVRALTGAAQFTLPYWDYNDPGQRSLPVEFRRPGDPVWGPLFFGHRWPRINAGKPIDEPPTAGPVTLNAMKAAFYKDVDAGGETIILGFCSTVQSDPHKQVHWSYATVPNIAAAGVSPGPNIISASFMAVITLSPGQHTVELKVGSGDGSSRRFRVYARDMSLLLFWVSGRGGPNSLPRSERVKSFPKFHQPAGVFPRRVVSSPSHPA